MSKYTANERNALLACLSFMFAAVVCDLIGSDFMGLGIFVASSIWGAATVIAIAIREARQ